MAIPTSHDIRVELDWLCVPGHNALVSVLETQNALDSVAVPDGKI